MNTLIRFLTFSASRPTHWYEREVYMLARGLIALAALVPSLLVSTPKTAPWILLSTVVSLVGAWSAQVARSGAARREEARRARGEKDVGLSCDAELRRAAAIGSFFASLAPLIALGMTVASASSTAALVVGIAGAVGSVFDVAWSAWIYPAWRRVYTRERNMLRARGLMEAMLQHEAILTPEQEALAGRMFEDPEDAPTEIMTRASSGSEMLRQNEYFGRYAKDVMKRPDEMIVLDAKDGKNHVYVRCKSFDEILVRVDADIDRIGTRLYLNDDSPVVERGEGGWFVDWLDGTTSPTFLIRSGSERERFLAMADGRLT